MDRGWAKEEFKNLSVDDGRIINRVARTVSTLAMSPEKTISQSSENWSEAKAIYRLIGNKKLTSDKIMKAHKKSTIKRIDDNIILAVQDTTELDYTTHENTEGLGLYGGSESSKGLIMHTTMAVTTTGVPLGILEQSIWARDPEERGKSRNCRKYPIEEKESYKWLYSMENNAEGVPETVKVVNVCDRDADLYEFMFKGIDEGKSFLIRVRQDRRIKSKDIKLYEALKKAPIKGEIIIKVPRDSRKKTSERETRLSIKYTKVSIVAPGYLPSKYKEKGYIDVNLIEAKEIEPTKGEEPIKWILFTDFEVETFEQAVKKVSWYVHRWKIERFHYVIKSGCKIQELQFETAEHLVKAIALYSVIAWRILWLIYQSRQTPELTCEVIFDENEWKVLDCVVNKKSMPRVEPLSLEECLFLVAKLGGFLARKSDGLPGVKVLWRGLTELNSIMKYANIVNTFNNNTVGNV